MRRARTGSLLLLAAVLAPRAAAADGGFFITEVESQTVVEGSQAEAASLGLVSSSGQRGVLWQRADGCWDLYIDPGTVALEGAAWIVPVPVVPEVAAADAAFVDELDAATTPVFVTQERTIVTQYRVYSEGGGGWGCMGAAVLSDGDRTVEGSEIEEGEEQGSAPDPSVTLWGSGRLGSLDYEIVSAAEATELEGWLEDNGYVVPDTIRPAVEHYVADGYVFFAARVVRDPDGPIQVPVVRFGLCDASPSYPVRLSAVSVAESLRFTLWVVTPPRAAALTPTGRGWQRVSEGLPDLRYDQGCDYDYDYYCEPIGVWPPPELADVYDSRLAEIFAVDGGRGLAVQYAMSVTADSVERRAGLLGEAARSLALSGPRAGWSPELREIVEVGHLVVRYVGDIPVRAMSSDVLLVPGEVGVESGVYTREITYRESTTVHGRPEEEAAETEPAFDGLQCRAATGPSRLGRLLPLLLVGLVALTLAARRAGRARSGP